MSRMDDSVAVTPELVRVIYEGRGIRIIEVKIKPGVHAKRHWHPENVAYVIAGNKMKVSFDDGTSNEVSLSPGQVINGNEVYHEVDNIGDTEIQILQVEFMG